MVTVRIDKARLEEVMWSSDKLSDEMQDKAQAINKEAAAVFMAEEIKSNEGRTSETTPPKYLGSFNTKKAPLASGHYSWLAVNSDPGAFWVEVGAHAGGRTLVLKYRPYGRALDILRIK